MFAEQTPDLIVLVDGLEQILQKVTSITTFADVRVMAASGAYVVLQCVGDAAGIAWAASRFADARW